MLRLVVREHGKAERLFEAEATRLTVGRGLGNDLALDNLHVSSRHALIEIKSKGAFFRDAGSTNGSMIQRGTEQIAVEAGGQEVQVYVGDTIVLGDSEEPVILLLLDDAVGGERHPVNQPPDTAISRVPVDPSIAGQVIARLAHAKFREIPAQILSATQLTSALFACGVTLGEASEGQLVENLGQALLALCPKLSHVYLRLSSGADNPSEQSFRLLRDDPSKIVPWSPGRGGLYVRTVVAREAWLVKDSVVEQQGQDNLAVPHALCVPLLRPQQSLGYLFADNRATGQALGEEDLAIAAALTEALAGALDAHRALVLRAERAGR